MTREDLVAERIKPNVGNGRDHIFKIICGAGKHSQGKAVLKPAIAAWLEAERYEHYADMQNGVFLVRLWKYWLRMNAQCISLGNNFALKAHKMLKFNFSYHFSI